MIAAAIGMNSPAAPNANSPVNGDTASDSVPIVAVLYRTSELMIVQIARNTGIVVKIDPIDPSGLIPAFLYRAIVSICFLLFIALLSLCAAYFALILDIWN